MNILINASNLKAGGALQVADSIFREIRSHREYNYVVVLSDALMYLNNDLVKSGIKTINYNCPISLSGISLARNKFLDNVVTKCSIDKVFTIFGPSLWRPKVPHLCGFARPHIIYTDSPFFKKLTFKKFIISKLKHFFILHNFNLGAKTFVTENNNVSDILSAKLKKKVYTATNNFNQIFDNKSLWDNSINLPKYKGLTCVTISYNYPHKNLSVIPKILNKYPNLKIRFLVTLDEGTFKEFPKSTERLIYLGKVSILQTPHLYEQSDIMFLPTLLECFSASYPEAMKMGVPIVTSDLPFAHGLCGDAALYCNTLSEDKIVQALETLKDKETRDTLIKKGKRQLQKYDSPKTRVEKYLKILNDL